MEPIKIAVLSGKGGTGKTFVSVNLASVAKDAIYYDCDVEEPNGNLFFQTRSNSEQEVTVEIPTINQAACDGCRVCTDFCAFNALVYLMDRVLVLEDLCHSCGGCMKLCPRGAISSKTKVIGTIYKGKHNQVEVVTGSLQLHYPTGVKIIEEMLAEKANQEIQIIDCPPGSSCPVIECVQQADFCLIVAEDTIFGLHNMKMVYELVKLFHKPHAVIINKKTNTDVIEPFCIQNQIPMYPSIPFDRTIARTISEGKILVDEDPQYYHFFQQILHTMIKSAHEAITRS